MGGGAAMLMKTEIACTALREAQVSESVFCKIKINGAAIIVGAVHRPRNASLFFMERLYEILEKHVT